MKKFIQLILLTTTLFSFSMERSESKPIPKTIPENPQQTYTPVQSSRLAELKDNCQCCLAATLCGPCYLWWVFGMGANKLK